MIFVCKVCGVVLIVKDNDMFRVANGEGKEIPCPICGKVSGEVLRRVY